MELTDRERLRIAVEAFHIAEKNLKSVYDFLGQLALAAIGPLDAEKLENLELKTPKPAEVVKPEGSPPRESDTFVFTDDEIAKSRADAIAYKERRAKELQAEVTSTVAESPKTVVPVFPIEAFKMWAGHRPIISISPMEAAKWAWAESHRGLEAAKSISQT